MADSTIRVYPASIASDVSQERLERFFTRPDGEHYHIGKQLRESIVFSRQNVICNAPFSKLDLISGRNLLIFLEPEMQQRVISLFGFALADHGLLVLAPSEAIARADDAFEPISKKWRILPYRSHGKTPVEQDPIDRLSDREKELFRLIGAGLTTGAIPSGFSSQPGGRHIAPLANPVSASGLNKTPCIKPTVDSPTRAKPITGRTGRN